MIAADYAKVLYESEPDKSTLPKLRALLRRRGHDKLLPLIFKEYEKLALAAERRARLANVTPEQKRTRILLQLYRKLTHATAEPINKNV